jgi:hypothetical protein
MTLFLESELRRRASVERLQKSQTTASLLRESRNQKISNVDVFLSHSKIDEELVAGAKKALEDYGLSVYVDWIDDPHLDRTKVCAATADQLRVRMNSARMLVYAHTTNSSNSKWCPWELGYFDGIRGGNVFIMPIVDAAGHTFVGQEYLGLYPYLDKVDAFIFINKVEGGYKPLREAVAKSFRRI